LVKVAAPIEQLSAEDAATGLENFES
jgi:hypothetical protein